MYENKEIINDSNKEVKKNSDKYKVIVKNFDRSKLSRMMMILILGIVIGIMLLLNFTNTSSNSKEILSESSLEKMLNITDLSTYQAIYNGISTVENEDGAVNYHVSYEAVVKAGLNFEDIKIDNNEEDKIITVTLPPTEITDINVDIASLDFIFENKKSHTDTVLQEAYKACINDVEQESSEKTAIFEFAQENAENTVIATLGPFIDQLDDDYKIVFK